MLKRLKLDDFTAFAKADLKFGRLNVIHGENSAGKTHVLKLAYSVAATLAPAPNDPTPDQPQKTWLSTRLGSKLVAVFKPDEGKLGRLPRRVHGTKTAHVRASFDVGDLEFQFSTRSTRSVTVDEVPDAWLTQAPVFLPTRELLSVYPGFVSLYETQAIPFDEVWRDTCLFLGAPIARGPRKKAIRDLLDPIEEAIECKAVLENGRFYVHMKNPNARVEADLVAEGYRKLTMVARLIANGSLDDKGYLFWDEPEANLNPRLVRKLAPLLLDLAAGGVQVFIATHSLFLMREIEIARAQRREARKQAVKTRYIGLSVDPDGVVVSQGATPDDSGDIAALDESVRQAERYLALDD